MCMRRQVPYHRLSLARCGWGERSADGAADRMTALWRGEAFKQSIEVLRQAVAQLTEIEPAFDKVIIGTLLERVPLEGRVAEGGEHHDRHGCRQRVLPHLAQDLEPVHPGHHDVEKDDVDRVDGAEVLDRLLPRLHRARVMTGQLEQANQRPAIFGLIVYYQDPRHAAVPSRTLRPAGGVGAYCRINARRRIRAKYRPTEDDMITTTTDRGAGGDRPAAADFKSAELLMVRHGESEGNVGKSTDPDCALTERGLAQARALAQRLRAFDLSGFAGVTSPYRRAVQTAEALELGVRFEVDDALREWGPA